jgi:hypothetical protein
LTTASAATELARLDAVIARTPRGRASLCPERVEATPLLAFWPDAGGQERRATCEHLVQMAAAVVDCFPENIFWDFDLLAETLFQLDTAQQTRMTQLVVALNRRFGRRSVIAFRYAHDFLYGYDWARWVKKQPEVRGAFGPFSEAFLESMLERGGQLETLIAQNDAKYPRLPAGTARNPFAFSREPEDEYRLLALLAERGAIPVPAWQRAAPLDYRRPFTQLREQAARELGLAAGSASAEQRAR